MLVPYAQMQIKHADRVYIFLLAKSHFVSFFGKKLVSKFSLKIYNSRKTSYFFKSKHVQNFITVLLNATYIYTRCNIFMFCDYIKRHGYISLALMSKIKMSDFNPFLSFCLTFEFDFFLQYLAQFDLISKCLRKRKLFG